MLTSNTRYSCCYFLNIKETRKDREVDRLFKILERVTELKGSELQTTTSLADIHLPKLAVDLQVAESIANKLIKKRASADSETLEKLERRREERVVEWDTFVHDMTAKCVKIDNSFAVKQEEIREAFRKTEEKIFNKKAEQSAAEK